MHRVRIWSLVWELRWSRLPCGQKNRAWNRSRYCNMFSEDFKSGPPPPTPDKKDIWFTVFWAPSCTWIPGILVPAFWWEKDGKSLELCSQILWSGCCSCPTSATSREHRLERRRWNLETLFVREDENLCYQLRNKNTDENGVLMKLTVWQRICFGRRWAVGISGV